MILGDQLVFATEPVSPPVNVLIEVEVELAIVHLGKNQGFDYTNLLETIDINAMSFAWVHHQERIQSSIYFSKLLLIMFNLVWLFPIPDLVSVVCSPQTLVARGCPRIAPTYATQDFPEFLLMPLDVHLVLPSVTPVRNWRMLIIRCLFRTKLSLPPAVKQSKKKSKADWRENVFASAHILIPTQMIKYVTILQKRDFRKMKCMPSSVKISIK